jgi:hypothetical protein
MDERGVRDSIGHRMNPFKAVAFKVVPDVIESGKIVHKENMGDLESFYISAPVSINGSDDIVTVLVHQDPTTRCFYLHSVATKEYLLHHDQSSAPANDRRNLGGIREGGIESILHDVLTFNEKGAMYSKGAKTSDVSPAEIRSSLIDRFGERGIMALEKAGILKIVRLKDAPESMQKQAIEQNASALYGADGVVYLLMELCFGV